VAWTAISVSTSIDAVAQTRKAVQRRARTQGVQLMVSVYRPLDGHHAIEPAFGCWRTRSLCIG
jgi:hypothetical protein